VPTGLFHAPALKCDLGILGHVEKLPPQMIVAFRNPSVDARRVNRHSDGGLGGIFSIHLDRPFELREMTPRGSEHMPDFEGDRRMRGIDL
jgi:hypothetical protein